MARVLGMVGFWTAVSSGLAFAQWTPASVNSRFELAEAVGLDRADSRVAVELERADAYVTDAQWDEAVATLRRVMEQSDERLWPVGTGRFIPLREYCQMRLAALPPAGLAVYRAQVDPSARRWYERGVARHDPVLLRKVVDESLAGSHGDDALLALGELELDAGRPAVARACWERILPASRSDEESQGRPTFPDTNLDPAAVRARMVLASILEGSLERAADELAKFERLHPGARGRLGGGEVEYAAALRKLMAAAANWPMPRADENWPTFAGAPCRTRVAPREAEPDGIAWRFSLGETRPGKSLRADASYFGVNISDVWSAAGPAAHPVRVGPLVLVNDTRRIWALKLASGTPAWGDSAVVYDEGDDASAAWRGVLKGTLGRPQCTMTVLDGKLYARMGHPWTGPPRETSPSLETSCLVAIDLAGEGRLLWKITPEPWAFEGTPLCDGRNVYVAMRRGDIREQAHVACYDAQTGRRQWRRFICAARTPGQNLFPEMTHNLLTLGDGTLFYNTNLDAVAALSTEEGRVKWVSLYPRRREGDLARLAPHWGRSLNPCVYHQGTLFVAPADSRRIFALDAWSGRILWRTGPEVEDAVHLLGVTGDQLVATGRRVYWIDASRENQGRIRQIWPRDGSLRSQGRGVLAGGSVYVPADDRVYVLDQRTAELRRIIELRPKGVAGGNLLVADGQLLIATNDELIALGPAATNATERGSVEQARRLTPKSPNP